jgi:hypothetical protein
MLRRDRIACLQTIDIARRHRQAVIYLAHVSPRIMSADQALLYLGPETTEISTEVKPLTAYRDCPDFWGMVSDVALWVHRMMVAKEKSIVINRRKSFQEVVAGGAGKPYFGDLLDCEQNPDGYAADTQWLVNQSVEYDQITADLAKYYGWPP